MRRGGRGRRPWARSTRHPLPGLLDGREVSDLQVCTHCLVQAVSDVHLRDHARRHDDGKPLQSRLERAWQPFTIGQVLVLWIEDLLPPAVGQETGAAVFFEGAELRVEQRRELGRVRPALPLDEDKLGIFLPADRGNTWRVEVHAVRKLGHGSPKNKRGPVARPSASTVTFLASASSWRLVEGSNPADVA